MFTQIAGFAFNLASLGITLQSGISIINYQDLNQWRLQQTRFLLKLKAAYDRIVEFDLQHLDPNSITWNGERNLRYFLLNNVQTTDDYKSVSMKVAGFFMDLYPTRYWLTYAYQNVLGQSLNSWKCLYCFAAYNVNSTYHIIVASVDKQAQPNAALINSTVFDTSINNYKNQAN